VRHSGQTGDTYDLRSIRSTPFPNDLLDVAMRLPSTEARVLMAVVRLTLGWKAGSGAKRRASVRMTYRDMLTMIGLRSPTVVGRAVGSLARAGILEVVADDGSPLSTAAERRRYHGALTFRVARRFVDHTAPVDNAGTSMWKTCGNANRGT